MLLEQVGSGAMGVVWRAHDELLQRVVAVKALKLPDLSTAATELARNRAMREARNAGRLHHPNAITVFDVVVEDGLPWLVMEYLPSRSLADLLSAEGPLEPAEAARIGGRVAEALAAAHAADIVHRDVKPANVLIGEDGVVKLTDFGISRAAGDGTITDAGMIAGTPAYLAPEVARGELPDTRSDVFSLGATLFAMTERKSPYGDTENSLGLLYRATSGKIEQPTNAGTLTPTVKRLLAVDPAERPTSAEVVELLTGTPFKATRKRRRWLAPTIAAAAVVSLAVAGTLVFVPPAIVNGLFAQQIPTSGNEPSFTPTDAANFVVNHYSSVHGDPKYVWENDLPDGERPPYDEFREQWTQYDTVTADGNPEVGHRGSGYAVDIKVTVTQGTRATVNVYRVQVERRDGKPKIVAWTQIG
jgi:serine/threonine protein kinase